MGLSRKLANLGSAIDSGQTSEFLTIDDSGGLFREVQYSEIANRPTTLDSSAAIGLIDSSYIQARQVDVGLDSALITQLVDSSYVQARTSSTGLDSSQAINLIDSAYLSTKITAGLDSSGVTNLVDSSYVAARASAGSGFDTFQYTATANQTTFEDSDVNGEILSYTADGVLVFYNGILLDDTVEYTASSGTSVVLSEPADSGATVLISKWSLGSSGGGSSAHNNTRAFAGGGNSPSGLVNEIQYWSTASSGNASDFGDLLTTTYRAGALTDGAGGRGLVFGGSWSPPSNVIQYITVASTGNATDFGDLTNGGRTILGGASDGTYGVMLAGNAGSGGASIPRVMDRVTVQTAANSTDHGDLAADTFSSWPTTSCAGSSRGIYLGTTAPGGGSAYTQLEYFDISSASNAANFGTLSEGNYT